MAKATISKSKQKKIYTNAADIITIKGSSNKIYTKGGKDKITISKGKNNLIDAGTSNDTIVIGKKAGNDNKILAGKGNDTITVNAGTQTIDGGIGNDTIIVKGGNNHTLRGGKGSDEYIINMAMKKNTRLSINQSDYKKKDADTLQLSQINKKDVTYGLLKGTLTIKHKTGGAIKVTGWNKNKFSEIIFKNGMVKAATVSKNAGAQTVTWKKGATVSLNANKVASVLQINGHKMGDTVAFLNSKGQLVLREKENDKGTLTISNWKYNTIDQIVFKYGSYNKKLTADAFKERIYTPVTLKDTQTYSGGKNEHQDFRVNFSEKTNIVINSANGVADQISFTNAGGWSNDHEDLYVTGNDLELHNWDSNAKKTIGGQIVIKDFMKSSVKKIEFSNQTYYLVTKSGTYTGSDTYSDRFLILDGVKNGNDSSVGDWNITLDGLRANDVVDFRSLPNNSRYYSMEGNADGKDMVLTYRYSTTPDTATTLGTLRLKNFFNADGSVNTAEGYVRARINREFYAGRVDSNAFDYWVWDRIRGAAKFNYTQTEKNYRWLYLNAGTSKADTVNLGNLKKPNSNYSWLYYAGAGDDKVTAQAGDMVYGGAGKDTIYAQGRMSDIHGGDGDDTITVRTADKKNLDRVVVRGESGNDTIHAHGSYLYLNGGAGNDEIHLYAVKDAGELPSYSAVSGSRGDDTIYIHAGFAHRASGSSGNDIIYAEVGDSHVLNGGNGDDEIHINSTGMNRGINNRANGGAGDDKLYIENEYNDERGQGHELYGNDGNDYLYVSGNNSYLNGGNGDDTLEVAAGSGNTLFGDAGNDIFTFGASSAGNNIISDYEADCDVIKFNDIDFVEATSVADDNGDVLLDLTTGGKVTLTGAAGKDIAFEYSDGTNKTKQFVV